MSQQVRDFNTAVDEFRTESNRITAGGKATIERWRKHIVKNKCNFQTCLTCDSYKELMQRSLLKMKAL